MRAVRNVMEQFTNLVQNKRIMVVMDNTNILAYINHQGGTHSWSLMEETYLLFQEALTLECTL